MVKKIKFIGRVRSGSVLDVPERLRVRASPASLRCVLEHDPLFLASYWFNPGRPVPT